MSNRSMNKEFIRHLLLYGLIGAASSALDYSLFYLLHTQLAVNEYISNIISVHFGIFLSFFLNRRYNFKKTDKTRQRFLIFYMVGLTGLGLSSIILMLGSKLMLPTNMVKLFSIVFVAGVQFLINKFVTFRK